MEGVDGFERPLFRGRNVPGLVEGKSRENGLGIGKLCPFA